MQDPFATKTIRVEPNTEASQLISEAIELIRRFDPAAAKYLEASLLKAGSKKSGFFIVPGVGHQAAVPGRETDVMQLNPGLLPPGAGTNPPGTTTFSAQLKTRLLIRLAMNLYHEYTHLVQNIKHSAREQRGMAKEQFEIPAYIRAILLLRFLHASSLTLGLSAEDVQIWTYGYLEEQFQKLVADIMKLRGFTCDTVRVYEAAPGTREWWVSRDEVRKLIGGTEVSFNLHSPSGEVFMVRIDLTTMTYTVDRL